VARRVLSDVELAQLAAWPDEVALSDLVANFTLAVEDLRWVRSFRSSAEFRLGLSVQLCALKFLGFVPHNPENAPQAVTVRIAQRLNVPPRSLQRYVAETSDRSRREHVELVVAHAQWRA